jgi:uncharacterized damage-inducible protein DinB
VAERLEKTTMNRQQVDGMWDHLRKTHGIGLRCVALIPEGKLDAHPIPNMRTPKELVVHMYAMIIQACIEAVPAGRLEDPDEKAIVQSIETKDDLVKYCRKAWEVADKAVQGVTDQQLQNIVKTNWGTDFPGYVMFGITHDEYFHHRGQLYAYLRAMGAEPPMVWDFEHNEPAFQPKAQATA